MSLNDPALEGISEIGQDFLKKSISTFKSDESIIESFYTLLLMRRQIRKNKYDPGKQSQVEELSAIQRRCTRRFHQVLRDTGNSKIITRALFRKRFTRLEKEIALTIVWKEFASFDAIRILGVPEPGATCIAEMLEAEKGLRIAVLSALAPEKRLVSSGLIHIDEDCFPFGAKPQLDPLLMEQIVRQKSPNEETWNVPSYNAFLGKLWPLIRCLSLHSRNMEFGMRHIGTLEDEIRDSIRRLARHYSLFSNTLEAHPTWPLCRNLQPFSKSQRIMVLLLLGKEMGFLDPSDNAFTGRGLACSVSDKVLEVQDAMIELGAFGTLRSRNVIEICGGLTGTIANEDGATLERCEFELTDAFLNTIQVKRKRKGNAATRSPVVQMEQLVLANETRFSIQMALAQAQNQDLLFNTWGLGEVMSYGRGVTLLFSGPPGTGKTSTAEAIAHALNRQIIVVNYSEIQDRFVGGTEKRIARCFRQASESRAVLFWDEADAMFYSRDNTQASWEVRDVNVLLQEIERFQGVCILATNRKTSLDKALGRRITLKIDFPRPDSTIRRKIWQKMTPTELPLSDDVDYRVLASHDLSGGEIKNVMLNAARIAALRGAETRVGMEDFSQAVQMEQKGKGSHGRGIGFC